MDLRLSLVLDIKAGKAIGKVQLAFNIQPKLKIALGIDSGQRQHISL
jgi:electron transfer flavoprotein alpha subunit